MSTTSTTTTTTTTASEPPPGSTAKVERTGAIARLVLNRPEAANAFSKALVRDLRAALARMRAETPPLALVITGAGEKAFCGGADLKERRSMSLEETRTFLAELNALMNEVASFPAVVIAAINGVAFGGGLELALACDFRLAVDTALLGLPEVRLGIIPGAGGTQRLARLCGVARAKDLVLTARRIDAYEAQVMGVVTEVVPMGDMVSAIDRLAAQLALAGPLALAAAKRAIDDGFGRPLADGLAIEQAAYESVLTTEDRDEGLAAFAEKRKPAWKGK
jgi:methylglutaconyl-CoA hydratase